MTKLKSDDMFPKRIVKYFGYDNETLFSVKLQENKVPVKWLDKNCITSLIADLHTRV